MKTFLEKIENIFNSKYGQLYIYGIVLFLCFFIMSQQNFKTGVNDDVFHRNAVENFGSAWNFMIDQYKSWNPRYFTSLAMAYIMDKNIWLWRILNSIVLFCLFYYLNNIIKSVYNIDNKNISNLIFIGIFTAFSLLPLGMYSQSITWVTGSFNYLWPATALIISFYYLFNFVFNKISMKYYEFILLIPIVLFATNMEQSTLIFLTMYVIGIIYAFIKYKTINIYLLFLFIFGLISAYFIFTSPSLSVRYEAEIKNWYPQFVNLSLFNKIILGYAYTVANGILLHNYQTTIVLSILLYIIYKKYNKNNKVLSVVILLPALYSLLYYICGGG